MALIAIVARYLRRPAVAMRALAVAVLLMLFWNPIIFYDVSFVLSVIATFGLITLGEFVERHITRVPAWHYFNIRSITASTIAVQIFILPALLYFSGVLSFVSLPANILVLPLVPLTMCVGFVAGMLGFLHHSLAFIPSLITDVLLRYMILVAEFSASLPFSSVIVPSFSIWIVVVAYVPLIAIAIRCYYTEWK
jgi:competence protein ComEC